MNWEANFESFPGLPATTAPERALYAAHFALLQEWNEKFNLVSRKSIGDAFAIHYADSLFMADRASKHFGSLPIIDLGTGAGFPGAVFAIRYPDRPILLLERSLKKQTFLEEWVTKLGLKNVQLAETFLPRQKVRAFVVSRAVLAPAECFQYTAPFLEAGSRIAMTVGGKNTYPDAPKGFSNLENTEYTLPGDFGSRKLSVFEYVPRGTLQSLEKIKK